MLLCAADCLYLSQRLSLLAGRPNLEFRIGRLIHSSTSSARAHNVLRRALLHLTDDIGRDGRCATAFARPQFAGRRNMPSAVSRLPPMITRRRWVYGAEGCDIDRVGHVTSGEETMSAPDESRARRARHSSSWRRTRSARTLRLSGRRFGLYLIRPNVLHVYGTATMLQIE